MPTRYYLDNNSTTPLAPSAAQAMMQYAQNTVGNPASAHRTGAQARTALEVARATVARCLGAHVDEVVFTSGATEANNLALSGLIQSPSDEVYYSTIEHSSVVEPCEALAQAGHRVQVLPVDSLGYYREEALPVDTKGLVSWQWANHETGTVQRLQELRQRLPEARIHTDATQAVGKLPVDFHQIGVSTLACSAHKFFGPVGIGVLLVNRCVRLKPRLFGGHQQAGRRPGTESVMLAVGLAAALNEAVMNLGARHAACFQGRAAFLSTLQAAVPDVIVVGDSEHGLVHTLNLAFPGIARDLLFIRLDLAGIDCSTGSACSSGSLLASPVLQAMGMPDTVLKSSLRFSLCHLLSLDDVTQAAKKVAEQVLALRGLLT